MKFCWKLFCCCFGEKGEERVPLHSAPVNIYQGCSPEDLKNKILGLDY